MTFIELSEVLGNLGEFVGSVAVVATLIYLAVQIRYSRDLMEENRKIALSQVFNMRSQQKMEQQRLIAGNDYIAKIQAKRGEGDLQYVESLDGEE